jgi:hypothetical protein
VHAAKVYTIGTAFHIVAADVDFIFYSFHETSIVLSALRLADTVVMVTGNAPRSGWLNTILNLSAALDPGAILATPNNRSTGKV